MSGNLQPVQLDHNQRPALVDRFGRQIDYLRISVTDRCDLRCIYCMAEDMQFLPRARLLTLEELLRIGRAFVDLGVSKIRITGGEPLTRQNIMQLFRSLGQLDGLQELTLTTNGTLLSKYADDLKAAGVSRINISIDTLQAERFRAITRVGDLNKTLAGIDAALSAGFKKVKLNAVIMRGRNEDEVRPLVDFALARGLDISFIEEMPLGEIDQHNRARAYCSSDEILQVVKRHFELVATTERTAGPSRYHRVANSDSRIGLISPHSHNFCDSCNRVRLTAEGQLLLCLGQEDSVDLRQILRTNLLDDAPLREAIINAMQLKPKSHEFDLNSRPILLRHMNMTGG